MKTAFLTGATGFLGLNLVEQLVEQDWEVTALYRSSQKLRHLQRFPVKLWQGDLTDLASIEAGVPEGVDAVFHVAANTAVWSRQNSRQVQDNVDGTRNVLAAARHKRAKRFVHTSTWNTFGLEHKQISESTNQTGGASWVSYTRTKYLAEQEVRKGIRQGLDAVILNPCHMIGRYDNRNWARMFVMVKNGGLPGMPPGSGVFAHAEAVAKAHLAAAERGRTGENYLLPGTVAPFSEVFEIIGELVGKSPPKWIVPAPLFRLIGRVRAWRAAFTGAEPDLTPEAVHMVLNQPRVSSDKAETELGYRLVPLRVMLEDAYAWLESEGLLG